MNSRATTRARSGRSGSRSKCSTSTLLGVWRGVIGRAVVSAGVCVNAFGEISEGIIMSARRGGNQKQRRRYTSGFGPGKAVILRGSESAKAYLDRCRRRNETNDSARSFLRLQFHQRTTLARDPEGSGNLHSLCTAECKPSSTHCSFDGAAEHVPAWSCDRPEVNLGPALRSGG